MIKTKKKQQQYVKLSVRKLPPHLSKQDFITTIEKYNEMIIYLDYIPGKIKENKKLLSRAILVFENDENSQKFQQQYSHVFVDEKGETFHPETQKSLYQTFQTVSQQNDDENTFQTTSSFQQFLKFKQQSQDKSQESKIENIELVDKSIQIQQEEDKKKKIEKIRTPIIEELDRVHGLKRNTNFQYQQKFKKKKQVYNNDKQFNNDRQIFENDRQNSNNLNRFNNTQNSNYKYKQEREDYTQFSKFSDKPREDYTQFSKFADPKSTNKNENQKNQNYDRPQRNYYDQDKQRNYNKQNY